MMIEMCQLLGGRSFDIDDVIMNVAGGCAGYVFSKKWHLLLVEKLSQRNSDGVI
jgi:glycopeptide antibiotics resistance protein